MRIRDEIVDEIAALVEGGRIRLAIRGRTRRTDPVARRTTPFDTGERIIAGYERIPESGVELEIAATAGAAMIADEPW